MGSNTLLDANSIDPQHGAIPRAVDQIFSTLSNRRATNDVVDVTKTIGIVL